MDALIYLALQHGPTMTGDDLERLQTLHSHAQHTGFPVSEVWPVYTPEDALGLPPQWYNARQDLSEGRFTAIILWNSDTGLPDLWLPEDLN